MDSQYISQTVDVVIDKDSELYRTICKAAKETGEPISSIINITASVGLYHHMKDNLKLYYKAEA